MMVNVIPNVTAVKMVTMMVMLLMITFTVIRAL